MHGAGGILTRGNAQVDPYRSCFGIARSARDAGARLVEHSKVRRMTGRADGIDIELEHGAIHADWAIVATGYATPELKPLAGRFDARIRSRRSLRSSMLFAFGRLR